MFARSCKGGITGKLLSIIKHTVTQCRRKGPMASTSMYKATD